MSQYKNIIFDLGGVIVNYDIEADTRALHNAGLPTYEECCDHPEISKIMNDFLNGLTPWEEYKKRIQPYCIPNITDEILLHAMDDVMGDIPVSRLEKIVELRKSHRVYLLSNICEYTWLRIVEKLAKLGYKPEDLFDQIFLSYEMQLAKPDVRIYQQVIQETGIVPEETIFFEDTQANLDGASPLGIQGCKVEMNGLEKINLLDLILNDYL